MTIHSAPRSGTVSPTWHWASAARVDRSNPDERMHVNAFVRSLGFEVRAMASNRTLRVELEH